MSGLSEKSSSDPLVNVLTIEPPAATRAPADRSHVLSTIEDVDSTHTLTPCPSATPDTSRAPSEKNHPFSPFYSHPTTRYSLDAQKSESKLNIATYADANDVEACITQQKSTVSNLKTFTSTKECTVWPGQSALKRKKKEMKFARQRNGLCGCMAGYSKRTRLIIKLVIALLVVGIAVAIGLGISRAVGGGIWGDS